MRITRNQFAGVYAAVLVALLALGACHPAPPNLSPAGKTAFQNTQIYKPLDLLRDIAVDGNATTPPVFTTATTRAVVLWHKSALTVVHARAAGWKTVLQTSLDELLTKLSASERQIALPYVTLLKTILAEV